MLPGYIVFIGVLIGLITATFYIKSIFRGITKPNLVSYFIWTLAPFIGTFFQIRAGAGLSVLPVFMAGFLPFAVFLFSIFYKNSYWKINLFDLICGGFAVLALLLYIITQNLSISILFAILSDSLAYIPTIRKTWNFPETETSSIYAGGIVSQILGLLTIKNWTFPIYSFSFSIIFFNLIVIFCIYRKKIFKTKELVH